ncbi:hypothetical protein JCM10908_007274 [Rhodotorula pacifica]|uniref:inositol polyphosphate multikinase n=1 Tax=Rhodotorula pacifica TaxID=1495444 RepID=UPI003177CC97
MAFAHQVGGHADTILASPLSSSTLIKPASERELEFYQSLGPSLAGGRFVHDWTPAFYGTLRAHRASDGSATEGAISAASQPSGQPDMLVLENLTHRFLRPNVLDIKLGTQLYDEDATEEKKERMRKAAEASTSGTTGVRLTGFQVWNAATHAYVQTEKAFGKSLAPDELEIGLARFFYPPWSPLSRAEQAALPAVPPSTTAAVSASAANGASPVASTSALPISADPAVGGAPSSTSSAKSATPTASTPPSPAPLPLDLLLPVLRTLIRRLKQLIELWQTLEIRMRGGSLLIIVEGDPDALERAIIRSATGGGASSRSHDDKDGGAADDEDDEDGASVSTTDEEGNAKPETLLPLEMRVIDFAHTRAAEGEGPDEGVLLGLRAVLNLLEGLTAKLEEEEERSGREDP